MRLLLDTANIEEITECRKIYPLEGITTNPTILAREEKGFPEQIRLVKEAAGNLPLHIQVTGEDAESMLEEAEAVVKTFGKDTYVKVPADREGLKAIRELKKRLYRVTATAIYSREQALLAGLAGADYAAIYYNRMQNLSIDSRKVVEDVAQMYRMHNIPTMILAASFKNCGQVLEAVIAGAHSATVPAAVLESMADNGLIRAAVSDFRKDWIRKNGNKKLNELL